MKTSAYFITHFALFTCHSPIPSPVIAVPGSFPYHTTMTETKITGIAINSFTTSTWRGGGKISANQALSHGEEAETTLQHGLSHGEEAETALQTGLSLMERRRKQVWV